MATNLCGQQSDIFDIPQWKKDLILRRRNQNRQSLSESSSCSNSNAHTIKDRQHSPASCSTETTDAVDFVSTSNCSRTSGQQPSPTTANNDVWLRSNSPKPSEIQVTSPAPRIPATSMVHERSWIDHGANVFMKKATTIATNNYHPPTSATAMDTNGASADKNTMDSDSSEELQYGPGIVNKLKHRYMSRTLRENYTRRSRPSILSLQHMRKAASLENLLEDDIIKSPINECSSSNGNNTKTATSGQHPLHPYGYINNYHPMNDAATSNGTAAGAVTTATRNASNRYRRPARGQDFKIKRAHSVETISLRSTEDSFLQDTGIVSRRQKCDSMCDNMFLVRPENGNYNKKEISVIQDYQNSIKIQAIIDSGVGVNTMPTPRVNRPTKIKPIMNESEKPPVHVVKEAKWKFEYPVMRTRPPHQTGEVAAKVATYSSIIVMNKVNKIPLGSNYHKPNVVLNKNWPDIKKSKPADLHIDDKWNNSTRNKTINSPDVAMVSPIPDVSRVMDNFNSSERDHKVNSSLCETPDLLLHSSPVHNQLTFQTNHINETPPFINGREGADSNSTNSSQPLSPASECSQNDDSSDETNHSICISPERQRTTSAASNSEAFNFSTIQFAGGSHLPVLETKPPTPPNHKPTTPTLQPQKYLSHAEPLHIDVNNSHKMIPEQNYQQLLKKSPTSDNTTPVSSPISPTLTTREIKKNNINTAKSREISSVPVLAVDCSVPRSITARPSVVAEIVPIKNVVPKPKKSASQPEVTTTFDFTHRNDVPDHVRNDGTTRNIDIPKSKDSGTTLLPGYEECVDIDLSSPPSPCDVTFINDNVLISGRSSISKRSTKRVSLQKVRLQFNTSPIVYEYPSEKSILGEDKEDILSPTVGHAVPLLSGSTLANYQPKSGCSIEDFQLGVTKTTAISTNVSSGISQEQAMTESEALSEVHEPIMFSARTTSDILF